MQHLNRAPLNGLRAAEAVERLGSLSAAARELEVSTGAVSQQIARLEAALGRTLFDRRPGGMRPLPGTEEIFRLLGNGFDHLSAAVDLTRRDRHSTLTVSVAPIFAARWLIWRIPDFSRAHPDIRIRLDSDVALVDPNTGAADFTIRIGPGPYHGVSAEPLFPQRVIPICHADVAARLPSPDALRQVPIIRDLQAMYSWDSWLSGAKANDSGLRAADLPAGPDFNEASLCLDAAMTGAGVFLAFETLCIDALNRAQITAPFPEWKTTGGQYWLISARDRSLTTPQRRFRQWLMDAIATEGMGSSPVPSHGQ
ncbi:LysR family transcriptional regulator [Pseudooceanicola nitratireducens]|uniref:LysR substrate-binding domain-containing protein n=1 Tax=Pseudooceanicola nitratireducens TaxID=517719 RepID=UPI001C93A415|nr:LysR substrate-binding domain-containing protein [Pseudooceanicola nitratireducens]MBY6164390.1 LysR family transcriptional regulator [Pseudooceanicola nitratireducens]